MAKRYSVEELLDCISSLEPIQASEIVDALAVEIIFLGQSVDLDACKWTGNPPRSCNFRTLIDLIEGGEITSLPDLQRMHACASIVALLDNDESSMSTSSESSTSSTSSWSSEHVTACVNYRVRSPRSFETETSTLGLILELLSGNTYWDDVIANGTLQITILDTRGGSHVPGNISLNEQFGRVIYQPEPDGSEAGDDLNIRVLFSDTASLCTAEVWVYIVVTEQTTTAIL